MNSAWSAVFARIDAVGVKNMAKPSARTVVKNARDVTGYVANVRNASSASEMRHTALTVISVLNARSGSATAVTDAPIARSAVRIAAKNAPSAHRTSFALPA